MNQEEKWEVLNTIIWNYLSDDEPAIVFEMHEDLPKDEITALIDKIQDDLPTIKDKIDDLVEELITRLME